MAKRKTKPRSNDSVSPHEIEKLRNSIREGYPWVCHHADNQYRQSRLGARLDILLSYCTGIGSLSVFGTGYDHPSRQTVKAVKAQLKPDIAEAERRFKDVFRGERYTDADFRQVFPHHPPRKEY